MTMETSPCRCHNEPDPPRRARCRYCGRIAGPDPVHECHADGCDLPVPEKMLMCPHHWRMVPRKLQAKVWATYVPGQEIRKDPTDEYMEAQQAAIRAVAEKEGRHG